VAVIIVNHATAVRLQDSGMPLMQDTGALTVTQTSACHLRMLGGKVYSSEFMALCVKVRLK